MAIVRRDRSLASLVDAPGGPSPGDRPHQEGDARTRTAAFARARAEGKPIFLSIGYSTCRWCHVMERESFSDPRVAAVLNRSFVSIKVDREERLIPHKILLLADGGPGQAEPGRGLPFLEGMSSRQGRATAYICEEYVCQLPTDDPDVVARLLDALAGP